MAWEEGDGADGVVREFGFTVDHAEEVLGSDAGGLAEADEESFVSFVELVFAFSSWWAVAIFFVAGA